MSEQFIGIVKWFNATRGYGFIGRDQNEDVFVHFTGIKSDNLLKPGQKVVFQIEEGPKGLQAVNVITA